MPKSIDRESILADIEALKADLAALGAPARIFAALDALSQKVGRLATSVYNAKPPVGTVLLVDDGHGT